MRIVFIVPAADVRRRFLHRAGSAVYGHSNNITGPLVLGSILKRCGHEVQVYEELYRDVDERAVEEADVVGLYTMTSNCIRAYELADCFRKMGKRVIIGGIHATALPEEALRHADQVVVGEAENVIADVVSGARREKIVHPEPVRDLDSIPFPDYTLLKTPCKAPNVLTTRGCPYRCIFCTTTRMFVPYRERSVANVIEELRVYEQMGFKYVNFQDDNLTANKKRAKELLSAMLAEDLVFKESFFFGRIDMAEDEELLGLLDKAHLRRTLIGIESLNQDNLDYADKRQKTSDITEIGERLKKHKIKVIASIVPGLDFDTREDIRESVEFCSRINAYQLQPAILTPYPGTPVFEQFKREGRILTEAWQYYDMMNVTFKPKKMTPDELQEEFFHSLRSFYSLEGAYRVFRSFGLNAGLRRLGFWFISLFARGFFERAAAKEAPKNKSAQSIGSMLKTKLPVRVRRKGSRTHSPWVGIQQQQAVKTLAMPPVKESTWRRSI